MSDVFNQILDGFEEFALITHNEKALIKIRAYRDSAGQVAAEEDKNESLMIYKKDSKIDTQELMLAKERRDKYMKKILEGDENNV